jgi:CheY-like chemotaxis protein
MKSVVPHILVVDDDQDIRETLRLALEDEGYEVEEAEDGLVGLSLLRASQTPLVALVDLRMPQLTGDALLQRVDSNEQLRRRHAFVLVTANRQLLSEEDLDLFQRMGTQIVEKPFELDTLLELVARVVDDLSHAAE